MHQLTAYYLSVLLQKGCTKDGYDFTACNNVREILYNTDVITFIVKLIVHSLVSKLIQLTNILNHLCVCVCV